MPRTKWFFTEDQRKDTARHLENVGRNLDNTGKGIHQWLKNATHLENWDFRKTEELRSLNESLNSRIKINMDKREFLEDQLNQTQKQLQHHANLANVRGDQLNTAAHLSREALATNSQNKFLGDLFIKHGKDARLAAIKKLQSHLDQAQLGVMQYPLSHPSQQSQRPPSSSLSLSSSHFHSQHASLPASRSSSLPHSSPYSSPQPVRQPRTTI